MSGYTEFVTATGCTVRIYPTGEAKSEGYGGVWTEPGALMVWRMDQPGDGRTVELHLAPDEVRRMRDDLDAVLATPVEPGPR